MFHEPLVSVILPVYNAQDYLPRCLESLLGQTHKHLHIICVDDCSADSSLGILRDFAQKDTRITVIKQPFNGGPARARNAALEVLQGKYTCFIDADDWLDRNYIEAMVAALETHPVDIAINKNILSEKRGESLPHHYRFEDDFPLDSLIATEGNETAFFWVLWNRIYRTDFLRKHGLRFPEGCVTDDVFFQFATFAHTPAVYWFAGPWYHYFDAAGSVTKTYRDAGLAHLIGFGHIYDYYAANGFLSRKTKLYNTMPLFNVSNEECFRHYREYFEKTIDYLLSRPDLYNAMDYHFARSILSSRDFADYAAHYPANAALSFIKRTK